VATLLQKRGHDVMVLTSNYGTGRNIGNDGDKVIRSLYLQSDIYYYRPVDFFLHRERHERSNLAELTRAIHRYDPDILLVWGMWNLSPVLPAYVEKVMPERVAYFLASYWPVDTDIHEEYWREPARRPLTELIKRPLRKVAISSLHRDGFQPRLEFKHAMCCSQYVRDVLVKANALPDSTGVLYGGINPEPFLGEEDSAAPPGAPLRLLYFGSLLPHKGVHTAIQALGYLKDAGVIDSIDLTILGSGHPDYEAYLKRIVCDLGVEEKVHFTSRVARTEIPCWLKKFDVFLFTTTGPEPMARTVMEAMAAGMLVIGSRVGGQVEMLSDGENSLTFAAGDALDLAEKIKEAVSQPERSRRLAQAGRRMALEKFTLERMVDDMETWLADIVKSRSKDSVSEVAGR